MLLDRMGYILAESFTLLAVISFTKGILHLRRGGDQRRFLDRDDCAALFKPIKLTASAPRRYFRYAVIFTLVTIIGALEIIILSRFGATIVTGALLLSCVTIVHRGLRDA